jgi:diguanylate cyclase (GGDEF)-like protein/PAS domain S-box-containing protein
MRAAQSLALPAFEATVATTPDHVRALEAALVAARAAEERFRSLVESIEAIPYISDWDALGTIRYISPQVERMLGYAREEWYLDHELWESKLHPDDREHVLAESGRTFSEERDFTCEYRMFAADGRVVWIAERETIVRDEQGRPTFCHGVMFDVTRLKTAEQRLVAAEAALRDERDLAQRYLDVARTLLLVIDADETVRLLNQHGHEVLGYPPGALIGCNWFDVAVPAASREQHRRNFRDAMAGRPSPVDAGGETLLVTATGDQRTMSWQHTLLRAADGTPTGTLSSGEDITDRLRAEAEIRRLAFRDALTGLASRSHFDAELRAAIAAGDPVGLLFVDLDDFKLVNDTLGHAAGDELLRAVADRLAAGAGAGLVGRHGGDEFLVLLRDLPADAPAAAREAAAAVTARLAEPYAIAGRTLRIRASVGAATCPAEASDADGLLRRADVAMYRVKRRSSRVGELR